MCQSMKGLVVLVGFSGVILFPLPAWSEPKPCPTSFSVKDFGAKGDGRTDDTKAIQAAFDAAGKKTWSEQYPGSAYFISMPVVFFPSGKYLVSDTIKVGVNVLGEGTAILQQKTADKDAFSSTFTWRWQLSEITFVAGRHHLDIGNHNIDTGRIVIEKCAFYNATGTAVRVRKGSNSTQITIRDCVFIHCDQALVNYCDVARLSDSWISTSPKMKDKAAIENRSGCLLLEDICGVPAVTRENDQRWIDNYSVATARNVRFGGESAGFTAGGQTERQARLGHLLRQRREAAQLPAIPHRRGERRGVRCEPRPARADAALSGQPGRG